MRSRSLLIQSVIAVAAVAVLAAAGYLVVTARAQGSGIGQPGAAAATPAATASPSPLASPSPVERWMVAKAVGPLTVYRRPSTSARVLTQLGKLNANNYPNVFLVHDTRTVAGTVWYDVYVAMRPNGTRGWIREGTVALYPTTARIVIDLSARTLTVWRRGEVKGTFKVAVGAPGLETPTGYFFVNQKLTPPTAGTPFGVLAIGISAFQMKLAATAWAQGGPVAIHGTNEPWLIGKAVSHGCVRMYNKDVLKVSEWVPTGSPVIIHK